MKKKFIIDYEACEGEEIDLDRIKIVEVEVRETHTNTTYVNHDELVRKVQFLQEIGCVVVDRRWERLI